MILALALVMSLALAACGESSAEDIAAKVSEKLDSITSMDAVLNMQFDAAMQSGGKSHNMKMDTVANITSFRDPRQTKMDMHLKLDVDGQSQDIDMETYAVEENGSLVMYTKAFGLWQKQDVVSEEKLRQYDAQANLNIYLDNATSFQVSTEQLDGAKMYRLQGTLSGESLKKALETSAVMDQLSQMTNGSEELYATVFDNLEDMPVTIWANKKDLTPVRYEMDMTQVMQGMVRNIIAAYGETGEAVPEDFEINCNAYKVSVDMSNYNSAAPITVPQEALDNTK
jgi:outer membrane lipoprotein-sorting protein